ncbi:invasion associated locus B family protein [Nitratireductor indicus]|uniref:Invasion protein B n=1 Tax=Nitratireductor indicus C115 TaxID=1231190 RepID=K2PS97_9HYPH|nr:invasion associated locus B family protein [Nitratireductor indicus]EKF43947.1 Invasion protein B [Nitratireductor indicus C115]MDS1135538.1 invasion associated locus B family protein [Nitratireductor indicus]SFQ13614.1 Invasion protein IalB, involved in pathogenesis [Nitratireductor indicus]
MLFRKLSMSMAVVFTVAIVGASRAEPPSSLSETYENWTVACLGQGDKRRCAFSQRQVQKSGQRVLAIELVPSADGGLRGSLVLPFGLDLKRGAMFSIDDLPPGKPSHFKTCLPVGCILALVFTKETTKALRGSETLKIGTYASDEQQEVVFPISLKGFDAALERTIGLTRK